MLIAHLTLHVFGKGYKMEKNGKPRVTYIRFYFRFQVNMLHILCLTYQTTVDKGCLYRVLVSLF